MFILFSVSHLDNALKIASGSVKLKLLKGECLAMLGRSEVKYHFQTQSMIVDSNSTMPFVLLVKEANEIATSCIQSNPSNADAIYVRALCISHKDYDRGVKIMEKAVKFDPDHEKAKAMLRKMRKFKEKEEMGNTFYD